MYFSSAGISMRWRSSTGLVPMNCSNIAAIVTDGVKFCEVLRGPQTIVRAASASGGNKMNRTVKAIAPLLCLLAAVPAWSKEIVVSQVAAFTGAQALSGKAIRAGIKLYLDHVNNEGGVAGERIRLVSYDDGYKADETVRLVKESLAKDAPIAFIGVLGTANNEALIKDG